MKPQYHLLGHPSKEDKACGSISDNVKSDTNDRLD